MTIGEIIQHLRDDKGLNQKELAEKVGLSHSVMNRIELGTRPARDEELKKIAEVLDVSLDYLMGASDIRNPYTSTEEDLTNEEKKLLETILKDSELSILFHELKNAPKKKIKQLLKTWEFINEQFDDMEKEGDE